MGLASTADAIPTLKNPAPILRQDSTTIGPWGNDGQNTPTDEGGLNFYFSPSGNDNNPCTQVSPCQTVAECRSRRHSGSNCLFQRGGVWNESLVWGQIPSGTSTNYTTFGAYGDTALGIPILDNNGASERIRGQRAYIWFDRIYFRDSGRSWVEDGSHHVVFSNGKVESRYTCFGVSALPNNIRGHHVTYANFDIGPCGYSVKPCINNPSLAVGFEGFYIGNSDPRGYGALDVDIYNVRIRDTTKDTFNVKQFSDNIYLRFSLIEDVQMCDDAGIISGRDFRDKNNIHIYGNIIRNVSKPGKTGAVFSIGQGMRAENNVVCGVRDLDLIYFGADAANTSGLFHNSFFDFEGILASGHLTSQNTFIKGNIGPGSISGNINSSSGLFTTTSSCRLVLAPGASSAINTASSCNGVVRDITWSARPVGDACDMGAHELGGGGSPPPPPPPPPPTRLDNYVAKPANGGSDSNDGSSAAPWATIQKCINSGLINPGSSCEIRTGEYAENLVINAKVGTALNNGYVIKPAPGATVTIKPTSGTNVASISSSAFVDINGSNTGHIILDADNITGFAFYTNSSDSRLQSLEIRNGTSWAIYGDDASDRMSYLQLHIHNNAGGIAVEGQHNDIAGNIIEDNTSTGVLVTTAGGATPSYNDIVNNIINDNGGHGISIEGGTSVRAFNNVVDSNAVHGISLGGSSVIGADIYYNSVYGNQRGYNDTGADGPSIMSNIFNGNTIAQMTVASTNSTQLTNWTTGDPLWLNPAGGNFSLSTGSPVINWAVCVTGHGIVSDIRGQPRPDTPGGSCDAGAYEGAGGTLPPPPPPPDPMFRFYVAKTGLDTNDGDSSTPFLTIQKCINMLDELGASCEIRTGVYQEVLTISGKIGTAYDSGYTIVPAPGATVEIKPTLAQAAQNILTLTDNSAYVDFNGTGTGDFILDGTNITGSGVFVTGHAGPTGSSADNSRIRGVEIRNAPSWAINSDGGSRSMEYLQNYIHDNGAGIAVSSQSNYVAGNIIEGNFSDGIRLLSYGDSTPGYSIVANNIVTDNASNGIQIDLGGNIAAFNNIVAFNGQNGIQLGDASVLGAGIYFNTVYQNGQHGFIDSDSDGPFIMSNIFRSNGSGQLTVTSDNATTFTNFTTVDPLWISPSTGDFHLRSDSPVINTAFCVTAHDITSDIRGAPRPDTPGGLCDGGAYEGPDGDPPPASANAKFIVQGGVLEGGQFN